MTDAMTENVRFHETADGAGPAAFRTHEWGGPGEGGRAGRRPAAGVIQVVVRESSLGLLLVARSARGLCAVLVGDDEDGLRQDLHRRFPAAAVADADEGLDVLAREVADFIDCPGRALDVPLDMDGTEFQRTVWSALRDIPPGSAASYVEVARSIGMPGAARAVARACAANPLAVVVPCHRVVRSDGSLAGYRWGVGRKRALLEREAAG